MAMSSQSAVFDPLTLPSGKVVKNRVVKAAMEENMAAPGCLPDHNLFSLYRYWAHGELGMIITGNVMVDRQAMTGAGGVVLEKDTCIEPFERWAKVIKSGGACAVMQINHPGRQVFKAVSRIALAPSAVPMQMGRHSKQFAQPREMTCEEIYGVTQRFVDTAKKAQLAGFDGVEIHAAHGYLLAQFLSPLTNQRQDQWGGALANRARLLLNIVSQIKAVCHGNFLIMVKLNASDFQRGGLTIEEAKTIVGYLNKLDIDCVEVSGGNYEAPAMQGKSNDDQKLRKHGYFSEFAGQIAQVATMPVMTTGGITSLDTAGKVLAQGCQMIGMASALATTPDLVKKWQQMPGYKGSIPDCDWQDKILASMAKMSMVRRQLRRLGNDLSTMRSPRPLWSLILDMLHRQRQVRRYRRDKTEAGQ